MKPCHILSYKHSIKYLCTLITEDAKCLQEIKRRIWIAKKSFWELKELMKSNINMNTKKRLLKTYIISLLTYGCEAWTISKEASRRINAFETWCYRRILKFNWINKIDVLNHFECHIMWNIYLQLGPRLTLQLVKIEEGLCDGEVLFHQFGELA